MKIIDLNSNGEIVIEDFVLEMILNNIKQAVDNSHTQRTDGLA